MTYHMWPQVLFASLMITVTTVGFIRNGQPMKDPIINGSKMFWVTLWMALVLGSGGFWDLR